MICKILECLRIFGVIDGINLAYFSGGDPQLCNRLNIIKFINKGFLNEKIFIDIRDNYFNSFVLFCIYFFW